MSGIKFADAGVIEGWAAPFGSPTHKDAQGEWFSPRTDFALDMIPNGRPLLISHGVGAAGPVVVGRITVAEKRAEGLWISAQLDKAGAHFGRIRDALAKGLLSFSSGTMAHLARVAGNGEILAWPLVETSLTDSPASADARIVTVKHAVEHYAAIGQPMTALKSLVFGEREPTPADVAYAKFARASASVDAIELRRAAAEEFARYTATSAVLDRRYGPARRR
jgi:hypothetical protein